MQALNEPSGTLEAAEKFGTGQDRQAGAKAQIFVGPRFQRRVDQDETLTLGSSPLRKTPMNRLELPADEHFVWDVLWQGLKAHSFSSRFRPD